MSHIFLLFEKRICAISLKALFSTDVREWVSEIDRLSSNHVVKVLVGNKSDLQDKVRETETVWERGEGLSCVFLLLFSHEKSK